METTDPSSRNWWGVIKAMASLVSSGYEESELTESHVRHELAGHGYSQKEIDRACEWIDKALQSGTLNECLSMLDEHVEATRLNNPIETICLSEKVWSRLDQCYQKGLLSRGLIERVLEGVRFVDTRDWEDDEVASLMAEMLSSFNPSISESEYLEMLNRCLPTYYC